MDALPDSRGVRAFLLDVEGTTTPITFVYDVLFPYARRGLPGFLRAHAGDPEVRDALRRLRQEHRADVEGSRAPPPWPADDGIDAALGYLEWLMDADRKSTALKALQGLVWQEGFGSGELARPGLSRRPPRARALAAPGPVHLHLFLGQRARAAPDLLADRGGRPDSPARRLLRHHHGAEEGGRQLSPHRGEIGARPGDVLFVSDSADEVAAALGAASARRCARGTGRRRPV